MEIVLIVMLAFMLFAVSSERRAWNGGISPAGQPWIRFDTDSQGGRGYRDNSGHYCWISAVDRRSAPLA